MKRASGFRSAVHAFGADKRAYVAVLFGLAAVPLITAIGATIDYSRAVAAKSRLDMIADSAALEAIASGSLASRWNKPDRGEGEIKAFFESQARSIPDVVVNPVKVTITQTDLQRTATVEYSATVHNHFGAFLKPTTVIQGKAGSTTSRPIYMDFYLLLDNSPSMGLGATLADIKTMEDATAFAPNDAKCAFACHETQPTTPGLTRYQLAKSLGVKMRIDLVRDATQRLIARAAATQVVPNQFRIGIDTFSDARQQISALTTNFTAASTAASTIDIKAIPYQNYNSDRYTDFDGLIPYLGTLPQGGNGVSGSSPRTILFLVSDGMTDEPTPGNPGGRTLKPIPIEVCNTIKSRNILIAALYTTYYPLPSNGWYMDNIAPFVANVGPAMQQCASPGLFFEVNPTQGIPEALEALFQKAVGEARLLN
jgi:Flp pilus assembly protein TadG